MSFVGDIDFGSVPAYIAVIAAWFAYKAYRREDRRDEDRAYERLQEQASKIYVAPRTTKTADGEHRVMVVKNASDAPITSVELTRNLPINKAYSSSSGVLVSESILEPGEEAISELVEIDHLGVLLYPLAFQDASGVAWIRDPQRGLILSSRERQPFHAERFVGLEWARRQQCLPWHRRGRRGEILQAIEERRFERRVKKNS